MVRVARSRNHQTQNAQRPQPHENCKAEHSWSTSPQASSPQRAGEGRIVCQPNTTTELVVRAQDEKLVRS